MVVVWQMLKVSVVRVDIILRQMSNLGYTTPRAKLLFDYCKTHLVCAVYDEVCGVSALRSEIVPYCVSGCILPYSFTHKISTRRAGNIIIFVFKYT